MPSSSKKRSSKREATFEEQRQMFLEEVSRLTERADLDIYINLEWTIRDGRLSWKSKVTYLGQFDRG